MITLQDEFQRGYWSIEKALKKILGQEMSSVKEGRAQLIRQLQNSSADERLVMLRWLIQRCAQENFLMKETLGPMYERELFY